MCCGDAPPADRSPPASGGSDAPASPEESPAAPAEAPHDKLPRSWKPELQEAYAALPPAIREQIHLREQQMSEGVQQFRETAQYGKALRDVLAPYQPLLDAQGVRDHAQAVRFLMNAHYQLSNGDDAARGRAFAQLAKSYGFDLTKLTASMDEPALVDPAVKSMQERLSQMETEFARREHAQYAALRAEKTAEVEAFAADPAHPFFAEVADDIALLLQKPGKTLQQAYDEAVWANPMTRAKQLEAERKTAEKAALEKAKADAARAAAARGTRIRGADNGRATPDPVGSMEQTMQETLAAIRSRT